MEKTNTNLKIDWIGLAKEYHTSASEYPQALKMAKFLFKRLMIGFQIFVLSNNLRPKLYDYKVKS